MDFFERPYVPPCARNPYYKDPRDLNSAEEPQNFRANVVHDDLLLNLLRAWYFIKFVQKNPPQYQSLNGSNNEKDTEKGRIDENFCDDRSQ